MLLLALPAIFGFPIPSFFLPVSQHCFHITPGTNVISHGDLESRLVVGVKQRDNFGMQPPALRAAADTGVRPKKGRI